MQATWAPSLASDRHISLYTTNQTKGIQLINTSAFSGTNRVKLSPGRLMDWNNFRFARRSLLNERNRLLSPSILQIA